METEKKISLPEYVSKVLERLEQAGYEAWCVGGCVRDSLLGLSPADWDVATNALPEESKACFPDCRTIDTGLKHGTISVSLLENTVEITTFRKDGGYADHRHPDHVEFSKSLEDDLSRRDFTINALAYHPKRGIRDAVGGAKDLDRRLLRCVGEPERRFEEDALRILRGLRFASVLGFSIEEETGRALREKRELLRNISPERIREELTKLLCGKEAGPVLREYGEAVFSVLPELAPMKGCGQENPYHCHDVWEHTLHALAAVPQESELRWAALLHDCGKPAAKFFGEDGVAHFYGHEKKSAELAGKLLERLRFSNRETESILTLVRYHGEIHPLAEKRVKKLLGLLGEENLFRLCQLSRADLSAQAPALYEQRIGAIEESEALIREILDREDCVSLRNLAVNGNDLLALGYPQGPSLGKALNTLLDQVLDGALPNERTALLRKAEERLNKEKKA